MRRLIIVAISSLFFACKSNCLENCETNREQSILKSTIPQIKPTSLDSSNPATFVSVPQACSTDRAFSEGPNCCEPLFPLIYDPISLDDPEPVRTSPRIREYY